ncbi:MAG: hypothetical protein EXR71_06280 [Myxococcales bacterium]|nr:hypothetical protein [Myxococcales bacterium]
MLVEVQDRVEGRWRIRVVPPPDEALRGFTVGLVGEDGVPLGPAIVAAPDAGPEWLLEVRGPCTLPPGAIVRVILHGDGRDVTISDVVVARRRGLHAWLSAHAQLPLGSRAEFEPLKSEDRLRLAARWCWMQADSAPCSPLSAEAQDILSEMGVDVDDVR